MGLWMLLFAGSTPFGGYLTGYLAEQLGVQAAIMFNAAMCAHRAWAWRCSTT